MAGAAFGDILGEPEREILYFSRQNRLQGRTSKVSEAAGARCDFLIGLSSDYLIIVGLSSNRLSIGGSNSRSFR